MTQTNSRPYLTHLSPSTPLSQSTTLSSDTYVTTVSEHQPIKQPGNQPVTTSPVNQWTNKDVRQWLTDNNLQALHEHLNHFDGASVLALRHMYKTAPTIYYASMKNDMHITEMLLLLKFTTQLERLPD